MTETHSENVCELRAAPTLESYVCTGDEDIVLPRTSKSKSIIQRTGDIRSINPPAGTRCLCLKSLRNMHTHESGLPWSKERLQRTKTLANTKRQQYSRCITRPVSHRYCYSCCSTSSQPWKLYSTLRCFGFAHVARFRAASMGGGHTSLPTAVLFLSFVFRFG